MGLVPTGDIVREAVRAGRGACAFNVIQLEHAEAIVAGAESVQAPVILQISENTVRYHGSLVPIGSTVLTVAQRARAAEARVRQWMTESVITIEPETTVEEAAKMMFDRNFRHLPVSKDGRLLGIVSLRRLSQHEFEHGKESVGSAE